MSFSERKELVLPYSNYGVELETVIGSKDTLEITISYIHTIERYKTRNNSGASTMKTA